MTKYLLVGYGSIGRRHMNNLLAHGERDIVVLRSNKSTLDTGALKDFPVETDLRAALAHKPDAAIIATPTSLHMDTAIPAAELGAHLLLEKPVSHSLDRTDDLARAAAESGSRIVTAYQFRWHPTLNALKEELDRGTIGRITSAHVEWGEFMPGWHPWEDYRNSYAALPELGGGVVLTLCHPFDYLRWLLGEVKSVYALTSRSGLGLEVEDTADALLNFQAGAQAHVHVDYLRREPRHRLEMVGSDGILTWDNATGALRIFRADTGTWQETMPPADFERNVMFMDEMAHFIQVVNNTAAPRCTYQDGIAALKICLAVLESGKTGKEIQLG